MFNLIQKKQDRLGFSIIEMMVSIFILTIIFGMVIANFRGAESSRVLKLSAQDFSGFLRKAQFWALSGKTIFHGGEFIVPQGGYGVRIETCFQSPCDIIMFSDFDGQLDYDAEEIINEEFYELPEGIVVETIDPVASADIVFKPPRPIVCINRDCSNTKTTTVTFRNKKDNKTAVVIINQETGQVSVE